MLSLVSEDVKLGLSPGAEDERELGAEENIWASERERERETQD